MGAAPHGPVLVGLGGPNGVPMPNSAQVMLVDLESLRPIDCKMPQQYRVQLGAGGRIRASADGSRVRLLGHRFIADRACRSSFSTAKNLELFYRHATSGWLVPDEMGRPHLYCPGHF